MFEKIYKTVRGLALTALITMTMAGAASAGTTTKANIDQMTGWQHCTVCAGTNGAGSTAPYSMQQSVSSPSMDGSSARFNLGGTNNYSNALWWKQLGSASTATHFIYDTYFYAKNPGASQALEFDVNQSVGGKKYIFGTQCGMKRGYIDIWSASTSWIHTSIPCSTFRTAYKWHHLVWEFQRTSDKRVKFVSVTINGKKSYLNKTYAPKSSSVNELNVAFQMDGDKYQTDYSVWLDKVKLTYW